MKDIDVYESVCHFVMIKDGSRRAAARPFGIDRTTVDKCLTFSAPPRYRQEMRRAKPKLGPFSWASSTLFLLPTSMPRPSSATQPSVSGSGYVTSMAMPAATTGSKKWCASGAGARRKLLCRWRTCLATSRSISACSGLICPLPGNACLGSAPSAFTQSLYSV